MSVSLFSLPERMLMPVRAGSSELRRRLRSVLRSHSGADVTRVALSVDDAGRVTLDGSVSTYAEKCSIEDAVKRVTGVNGVRNRLEVRVTIADYRTDATLERVLHDLFEFLSRMPPERPRAVVTNGWVTLEGTVLSQHQKQLIERAVREIAGVRGITNRLIVERGHPRAGARTAP